MSSSQANQIPFNIAVSVFFDPICPWCYIGAHALQQAALQRPQYKLKLNWRCFFLNPKMPASGMDRNAYLLGKFGGISGYQRAYEPVVNRAHQLGLNFALEKIKTTPSTVLAHQLVQAFTAKADTTRTDHFVFALFKAYFEQGKDIGNQDVLYQLALDHGLEESEIMSAYKLPLDAGEAIQTYGINGVPFFLFEERYSLNGAQPISAFIALMDLVANQ